MPTMTDDLYPVFVLSCTSARQIVSPNVYIVPVGAHDCWAKPYFEQIIDAFYEKNEFREQFAIKLDEMLLLNNLEISSFFEFSMVISLIVATLILVFRTQLLRLLFGKDEADVMVYKRGKLYSPWRNEPKCIPYTCGSWAVIMPKTFAEDVSHMKNTTDTHFRQQMILNTKQHGVFRC